MRIKEVEDLTGLTRKAIRYYEENGLIQTVKGANGYKEYDEETVKCLLEIKDCERKNRINRGCN